MINRPDAHQFVTTARIRAQEILARTGRPSTLDETKAEAILTFNYPARFKNLITSDDLSRFRARGLTDREVGFSTSTTPIGQVGRIRFVRVSDLSRSHDMLLKPELGPDIVARAVVEFMASDKDPEFPIETLAQH